MKTGKAALDKGSVPRTPRSPGLSPALLQGVGGFWTILGFSFGSLEKKREAAFLSLRRKAKEDGR